MAYVFLFLGVLILLVIVPKGILYQGSTYGMASGNGFFKTIMDTGIYGEFLIYRKLEKLDCFKKLMTNVYIPKADGSTTEIDVLMLCETGIYVFESKNYSGWIYGDEKQKDWTQTIQNNQKNRFYNPIKQNNGHIQALKAAIDLNDAHLYKSYIVFSERCTLKKITVTSKNIKVMKRDSLMWVLKKDIKESNPVLDTPEIMAIYEQLVPYCLVDQKVKEAHIRVIEGKSR